MIWLQLLGVWGWLKKAALSVFSAAVRYPWQAALIVAVVAAGWQFHRANGFRAELAAIRKAQDEAAQAQAAVNAAPAIKSEQIARQSDVDTQAYYDAGRRAGAAYANAHRVSRPCAPVSADMSGPDSPAPVDDRTSVAPDMVAVSRQDFDLLTGNSVRLAKVQQDAQALIDAGVAVELPEVDLSGK